MTEPIPEKPSRRPRYHGKNPRGFAEKYKEHRAAEYPEDVAKVIAGGKTPAGMHRPILVEEILRVLAPRPGETAIDCTLGYGGHARALLAAIQPGGRLVGIDVDPIELPKTEARLLAEGFPREALVTRRVSFAALPKVVADLGIGGADAILADLGASSMQLDDPRRGFSFKENGPLDMRMNPGRVRPASDLLATLDEAVLARILSENADEPLAAEIAAAIVRARPIGMTYALADIVRETFDRCPHRPPGTDLDSVRRVFQAIRIEVNGEFQALDSLLRALPACLKPGGRVAILSFHSGEDRRVKAAFKEGLADGTYASIAPEVIRASWEEQRANPRSTAAKLRYAVRNASPLDGHAPSDYIRLDE